RHVTAVLLTPEGADLVHAPPSGRRAFPDGLLGRLSPRYGALMRAYHRVVEQRNDLLRVAPCDPPLDVGTGALLRPGPEIGTLRGRAGGRLAPLTSEVYADIAGPASPVLGVTLERSHACASLEEALASAAQEERARGVTPVGPHRDDPGLTLAGHSIQA